MNDTHSSHKMCINVVTKMGAEKQQKKKKLCLLMLHVNFASNITMFAIGRDKVKNCERGKCTEANYRQRNKIKRNKNYYYYIE